MKDTATKTNTGIMKLTDTELRTAAGGLGLNDFVCPVKVGEQYHLDFGYRHAYVEVIEVNFRDNTYYIKTKQILQYSEKDYIFEYAFDYFWSHVKEKIK